VEQIVDAELQQRLCELEDVEFELVEGQCLKHNLRQSQIVPSLFASLEDVDSREEPVREEQLAAF
jgi:hypothetical protein